MDEKLPYVLSPTEYELVEAIAETIIPSGDNPLEEPGAREVGAKNYFDSRLLEMSESEREQIKKVLHEIEKKCIASFGVEFKRLEREERQKFLIKLLSDPIMKTDTFKIRSLCLEGYYSDYRDPWYYGKTAWDVLEFKGKRISGIKKDFSFLKVYQTFVSKDVYEDKRP